MELKKVLSRASFLRARNNEFGVVAVLALITVLSGIFGGLVLNSAMSDVSTERRVANTGVIETVGIGLYWDKALTNKVTSIDWGVLDPGFSKNVTVYIRNEGNSAVTLSESTSNWNPSNASNYIDLTWDYRGQSINVGSSIQVRLILVVSASITGISSFSFDITVSGTG
jgi:hypothetical protein